MRILAIETSCDETAAAVVEDGCRILSDIVSSQVNIHSLYGGVVPEIASRLHAENISAIIEQALREASCSPAEIDAVAYTVGPGLIGCLHVGVQAAKAVAFAYDRPMVPVNHMTGHIYANRFVRELVFPLLALVISGGHSLLVYMASDYDFKVIGTTRDDAIGEAYDKVARILGLGYPGGPVIDKLAKEGQRHYHLPTPHTANPYDFSFSGLKSAVSQLIAREVKNGNKINPADVAYAFQETALTDLVNKTMAAVKTYQPAMVVLAGGVAANSRLRGMMNEKAAQLCDIQMVLPPLKYCTDNAAMIGASGYVAYNHGIRGDWQTTADPGLLMPGEEE